jgi:hypothetical protein
MSRGATGAGQPNRSLPPLDASPKREAHHRPGERGPFERLGERSHGLFDSGRHLASLLTAKSSPT